MSHNLIIPDGVSCKTIDIYSSNVTIEKGTIIDHINVNYSTIEIKSGATILRIMKDKPTSIKAPRKIKELITQRFG